jgi:uncharacterized phage-associated protein
MPYPAVQVANWFLHQGRMEEIPIDDIKLQELLYCLQGWFLAGQGEPAIEEEFEAWTLGPVVPAVYHQFKARGGEPIPFSWASVDASYRASSRVDQAIVEKYWKTVSSVWEQYKYQSAPQLSAYIHKADGPWAKARAVKSRAIPNDDIRDYFLWIAASLPLIVAEPRSYSLAAPVSFRNAERDIGSPQISAALVLTGTSPHGRTDPEGYAALLTYGLHKYQDIWEDLATR